MKVGQRVRKVGGTYQGEWIVVSVFETTTGQPRLVCESCTLPGLLHIFAPHQMEVM